MKEVIELAQEIYKVSGLPLELCGAIAQDLVERGYGRRSEGEWVKNDHGDTLCSHCRTPVNYKSNYCPNCGSRNKRTDRELFAEAIREAFIRKFEAELRGWRPADDWPPESDGRYLLATCDGEMLAAKWENGVLFCPAALNTAVKWWMPAPELPES